MDIARGVGMILVIYAHALELFFTGRQDSGFDQRAFAQWQVIFSFHMPLFFFVSGAVNGRLSQKSWAEVAQGALFLIIIANLSHFAGWVLSALLLMAGYPSAVYGIDFDAWIMFGHLFRPILKGADFSIIVTWFLVSLAVVQTAAYALLRYRSAVRILVVVILVATSVLGVNSKNFFQIKSILPGLLFFLAGYLIAEKRWKIPKTAFLVLLPATIFLAPLNDGCALTWGAVCGNESLQGHFGVWMIAGQYGYLPLFLLTAMVGTLGLVSFSEALVASSLSKPFERFGRRTLELLLINGGIVVFVQSVIRDHISATMDMALLASILCLHIALLWVTKPVMLRLRQTAASMAEFLVQVGIRVTGWARRLPRSIPGPS